MLPKPTALPAAAIIRPIFELKAVPLPGDDDCDIDNCRVGLALYAYKVFDVKFVANVRKIFHICKQPCTIL